MANLIRWSPLSDLMSLHCAMDRLFGDMVEAGMSTGRAVAGVGTGYLLLDVYQTTMTGSSGPPCPGSIRAPWR